MVEQNTTAESKPDEPCKCGKQRLRWWWEAVTDAGEMNTDRVRHSRESCLTQTERRELKARERTVPALAEVVADLQRELTDERQDSEDAGKWDLDARTKLQAEADRAHAEVGQLTSLVLEVWRLQSVAPLEKIIVIHPGDGLPSVDLSKGAREQSAVVADAAPPLRPLADEKQER